MPAFQHRALVQKGPWPGCLVFQNPSRTRQEVELGKKETDPELPWTYKSMAQWQ